MAGKTQKQAMYEYVVANPGCTTKEFALAHYGPRAQQPMVNESARQLEREGRIVRRKEGRAYRLYVTGEASSQRRAEPEPGEALGELLKLGFEHAGWWEVQGGKAKCRLFRHEEEEGVLYAFVVGRAVTYIGKTGRSLAARMGNYEYTHKSRVTTIRCNKAIVAELESGRAVDVYVLPDREGKDYRGHRVKLADGLEPTLIAHFRPPWNATKS